MFPPQFSNFDNCSGTPPPELRVHTYLKLEGDAVGLAHYRPAILTTQAMLQSVAPRHGLSPNQAQRQNHANAGPSVPTKTEAPCVTV